MQIRSVIVFSIVSLGLISSAFSKSQKPLDKICQGSKCGDFQMSDAELADDLKLLEKLVNIPSETNDIAGVTAVANLTAAEFQKIGFTAETFKNPTVDAKGQPISADLLVVEKKGAKSSFITFIVHVDTVFKVNDAGQVPVPFKVVDSVKMPVQIPIAGPRVMGSGVADNKGGVVLTLRAIKMLLGKNASPHSLRVIVSTNEEVGSPGNKIRMAEYAKDSVAVLGVEPSGLGHILNGRGGVRWYEANITGVEAHGGVAHERGVNACLDLSIKLAKAADLTNYDRNVTVNVGTISGGTRANIVCGKATSVIDTRFPDKASDEALQAQLSKIMTTPEVFSRDGLNKPSQGEVKTITYTGAFESNEASLPYFQRALANIKSIDGFEATTKYSRGGADISNLVSGVSKDTILMDGLGPVTDGSHTVYEYLILETMRSRALVLADLVAQIK